MKLEARDVVLVDGVRTAMAKAKHGAFRHVRAENLSAQIMQGLLERNPALAAAKLDDILWGCVNQTLEQGYNIARNAALLTSIPHSVPAQTINRLCGSSMSALHLAFANIKAGLGNSYLVGGVEHMEHVSLLHGLDVNPTASLTTSKAAMMMGLTAELIGRQQGISRAEQDAFALRSHQKAAAAAQAGKFAQEIIGVEGHDALGQLQLVLQDEVIRPTTSLEELAALPPVFDPQHGTVTAGSSSALAVGASGMLVTSYALAQKLGLTPRAKIVAVSVAGCDPAAMGYGPVPASQKALAAAGLTWADIDVIELNEAFAAQALAVLKQLNLLNELDHKVNLNGGAVALGHPLGCSGTRITTTLLNLLEQQDATFGLATMCVGMGQGVTTILQRL